MSGFLEVVLALNPEPYPWTSRWGTRYNFGSSWAEIEFEFDGDDHYTCAVVEKEEDLPENEEFPVGLYTWVGDVWGTTNLPEACSSLDDVMREILEAERHGRQSV